MRQQRSLSGGSIEAVPWEPLSPVLRRVLLASVIFFHVGAGYALSRIEPARLEVGDVAPMEVSFVSPPSPPSPTPSSPEPEPPPPEPPPQLESMIQPQPPDLPPPVFPIEAPPPKPAPPKPPPPKPRQVTAPPSEAPPQPSAAPPAQQAAPRTVTDAQVGYLTRPSPIYPMRSKRAGEQGTVMVKVLVDPTGRPSQVLLHSSSGHPALDESALSALRAARFRPFVDAGIAQPVWVFCPIGFALQ